MSRPDPRSAACERLGGGDRGLRGRGRLPHHGGRTAPTQEHRQRPSRVQEPLPDQGGGQAQRRWGKYPGYERKGSLLIDRLI